MQYRETGPSSEIGPRRQRRLAMKYRRRRTVVAILAVLVIAVPVTVVSLVHGLKSNITSSPLRAGGGEVPEKITDELNVLILGSDTRELDADDYGSGDGARSDAMILAHISDDSSRIDAIQIPRDTMMDMPACQDTGSGASEPR
ncbi:MAG: LCP family protein, partial [Brevibacterium aurantiacum]